LKFLSRSIQNIKTKTRKIQANCQLGQPNPSPGNNDQDNSKKSIQKKDNPLLKNNSELVKGERIPFLNYSVEKAELVSAVYCIYCQKTGKYAVGETKNLKKRAMQHFQDLKTGKHKNRALQQDLKKYGLETFEFIVYLSGPHIENSTKRKNVQDELIRFLNQHNASYTSGLSETTEPRFEGKYPTKAGVFFFYCQKTDRYYYGHTAQKLGIGGRIRSMIAALNQGKFRNQSLQNDWTTYGEGVFQISAYVYGDEYVSELLRVQVLNSLIYHQYSTHPNKLLAVYNTQYLGVNGQKFPIKGPPPIEFSSSLPKKMEYGSTNSATLNFIFYPSQDKFPSLKPISLADRIPVYAEGCVYLSIKEASECFDVHQNVIRSKVEGSNPDYRLATMQEIQLELERRDWSLSSAKAVDKKLTRVRSTRGIPKSIVVERQLFPTIQAAATHSKLSSNAIKKWPRTGNRQAFFPSDYSNGKHPNPSWNPLE
jgi:hypothetical protein